MAERAELYKRLGNDNRAGCHELFVVEFQLDFIVINAKYDARNFLDHSNFHEAFDQL